MEVHVLSELVSFRAGAFSGQLDWFALHTEVRVALRTMSLCAGCALTVPTEGVEALR